MGYTEGSNLDHDLSAAALALVKRRGCEHHDEVILLVI